MPNMAWMALQIATIIAGFMLIAFGLFRLGAVIKFIPVPVIIGFTSGIAVALFVGQWALFSRHSSPTRVAFS